MLAVTWLSNSSLSCRACFALADSCFSSAIATRSTSAISPRSRTRSCSNLRVCACARVDCARTYAHIYLQSNVRGASVCWRPPVEPTRAPYAMVFQPEGKRGEARRAWRRAQRSCAQARRCGRCSAHARQSGGGPAPPRSAGGLGLAWLRAAQRRAHDASPSSAAFSCCSCASCAESCSLLCRALLNSA